VIIFQHCIVHKAPWGYAPRTRGQGLALNPDLNDHGTHNVGATWLGCMRFVVVPWFLVPVFICSFVQFVLGGHMGSHYMGSWFFVIPMLRRAPLPAVGEGLG